jgi:hypothetical protein
MTALLKGPKESSKKHTLLAWHREHVGLYGRVASRLGVHASYVSRVASGERKSVSIMNKLQMELSRLYKQSLGS